MKEKRTKVKICGLTREEEVRWIVEENADYFGVVLFFEKSKRNNSIEKAKKLLSVCREESVKMRREETVRTRRESESAAAPRAVAVTVSPTLEQIREIEDAGFDMIQIHGELSDKILEAVSLPVIRALPASDKNFLQDNDSPKIAAYLFDAQSPGSGQTFDWTLLDDVIQGGVLPDGKLMFLAGGLHCDNVREAIRAVHPDVVDVSSGVEREAPPDGAVMKDEEKIREFIRKVRTDER